MESSEAEMTMRMRPTEYPHIFWNEDKDLPCIAGTRLRVQDVVEHYRSGRSVEEIHEAYPSYSLAEILSALAYYYDHQVEMDRAIAEAEQRAEAARAEMEAREGPSPLREKLRSMGLRP